MSFLLYGAYGYTGTLIANSAKSSGMDVTLSGRDPERLQRLANRLDLHYMIVDLADDAALEAALSTVTCVLNCAGPFTRTAAPIVDACFRTNTHYLDITGELPVLQDLAARHNSARAAGITLLPAVGFDVVPTDCIGARLSDRLPGADVLELAFFGRGKFSRGTAKSAIEHASLGGFVRHNGRLQPVPAAWHSRTVDFGFGYGPAEVVSVPWGDLVTADYSAQIPTIITYGRLPEEARAGLQLSRFAAPLLKLKSVKRAIGKLINLQPKGPSPQEREKGETYVWGQASRASGDAAVSRLHGPEAYDFTVASALEAVRRTVHGSTPHGFQTPATAFGHSFVESIPGVTVEDVR